MKIFSLIKNIFHTHHFFTLKKGKNITTYKCYCGKEETLRHFKIDKKGRIILLKGKW